MKFLLFVVFGALMLVACGGGNRATGVLEPMSAAVYLSLGDSVAAGNGASDRDTTSFGALVAHDTDLGLVNLAVAGATTTDVIDKQLSQIEEQVGDRRVELITLSAGGNDLAGLIPNTTCQEDPLPASCPLDETLADVQQRLDTIVSRLRTTCPEAAIVLLAYPNFFSGTGHVFEAPASRVLPQLGETLRSVASGYERVAVAAPSFEDRGGELTHVLDEQFDPHPNDVGHRIIADAIVDAWESVR